MADSSHPLPEGEKIHLAQIESDKVETGSKTRVHLQYHLFAFPMSGSKGVYAPSKKAQVDPSLFLLLPAGHYLMTERMPSNGTFKSLAILFDPSLLQGFFLKYPHVMPSTSTEISTEPFHIFDRDPFLRHFIASLELLLSQGAISQEMKQLKWEELILYLCQQFPERIRSLQEFHPSSTDEFELRKTVESHLEEPITLEELAFLCHMSLSTFKRKFVKLYGTSPNRWMLQRRMEMAAHLLRHEKEKPSNVFYKVGYENLSSFIQSFKQTYGVTPGEFQQQKVERSAIEIEPMA